MLYTPDPLLDEEVTDALTRDDPAMIWAMTATLATMTEEVWQLHRAAIKARFGVRLNIAGLDKAVTGRRNAAPPGTDPPAAKSAWEEMLHCGKTGNPQKVLINADIALRNAPEWAGVFELDSFKSAIMVVLPPPIGGDVPRVWADEDNTRTAVWLQEHGIYVGTETVATVVASVAQDRKRHAVREYLAGVTWDQEPRVDGWLTRYLGVERSEYSIQVGRMWLISAIARIMQPGCKADYMLVLEGEQGKKKSTVLEILASQPWFCDHSPDIHHKDAQTQIAGTWIMEWGELDALNRSEITAVKAFVSRRVEKFRPSYGRYQIEVPRQCVFAGTTNKQDWQRDETGGRRYWPVWCGEADLPAITADRDQLWAEAAELYASGAKWWPDDEASHARLAVEQAARLESDPWQERIGEFVALMDQVAVGLILTNCIGLDISRHTTTDKNRVGRVLRALGWRYTSWRKKDDPNVVVRGFSAPGKQGTLQV